MWYSKLNNATFIIPAGPWTVFAPTNSAFANLPAEKLESLASDASELTALVLDHVVNKTFYTAGIRDGWMAGRFKRFSIDFTQYGLEDPPYKSQLDFLEN